MKTFISLNIKLLICGKKNKVENQWPRALYWEVVGEKHQGLNILKSKP